jgi:hypothetical protein
MSVQQAMMGSAALSIHRTQMSALNHALDILNFFSHYRTAASFVSGRRVPLTNFFAVHAHLCQQSGV